MTKYCGKDFLVKREDQPPAGVFTTVAYMRSTGMTINNEVVDVTTKTDTPWRQLLDGCGIQSMTITLAGVVSDDASFANLQQDAIDKNQFDWKLVSGAGDEFEGPFEIASLERSGEYNADEQFTMTLESAGTIVYTP